VSFVDVEVPLRLQTPSGDALPVTVRELTYVSVDGVVERCLLDLELNPDEYAIVDRDRLFHLDPDVRHAGAERFRPEGPVRVEIELAPTLVPDLVAVAHEAAAAADHLSNVADRDPTAELLETESWYARSVSADVDLPPELAEEGVLRSGYATRWAADGAVLELPMLAVIEEVLADRQWHYTEIEDDTGFQWRVQGPDGAWSVYALARGEERRFAVYSILDVTVPHERRTEAAELVARANHGLPVGNWELDMDDGGLRYKTAIDVVGGGLSLAAARRLIERNLSITDAYLAAFTLFAEGKLSAGDALRAAEG